MITVTILHSAKSIWFNGIKDLNVTLFFNECDFESYDYEKNDVI